MSKEIGDTPGPWNNYGDCLSSVPTIPDRLFCCCMPTGWVWSDREVEEHGDYRRLAYMNYGTLELDLEPRVPKELERRIMADAFELSQRRGERYAIACNITITLGEPK